MVVDYDGRILAQADPGPGEKVVVAPINIDMLRDERARRQGHDTRAHYRAEIHDYAQKPRLTPAGAVDPITIDGLNERITIAKKTF